MNASHPSLRRISLVALVSFGIVVQATTKSIPTLAASTDIVSAIPGHHYTTAELQGYSKDQLVDLVESLQAENESAAQTSPAEAHHSGALAVIGAVLGGIGFAMLASRVQSHAEAAPPMNQFVPSGITGGSVRFPRLAFALPRIREHAAPLGLARPITVVPFTASSCNSSSQLLCNVNVKTDTCNSLSATQAFVTSMSSLLASNQASKGTTVDQSSIVTLLPSPGSTVTPSASPGGPASTSPGMMPAMGAAAPLTSMQLSSALTSYGYSSQQAQRVLGALSSSGVALLGANGQPSMTKSGAVNSWQVGSTSANFLISLANIWIGCNNQVTTTTSPAPPTK